MKVITDGFEFQFTDALDAFIFDETDKTKLTFHGMPMKCVDIVVEFENAYVYIELKDYQDTSIYDTRSAINSDEKRSRQEGFKWLKNYLKYKFRDSYLYRHAEQKVEKPIHYICLLTFENALNSLIQKELKKELPVGKPACHPCYPDRPHRWLQELAKSCQVMNMDKWNEEFPKWPVTRLPVPQQQETIPVLS